MKKKANKMRKIREIKKSERNGRKMLKNYPLKKRKPFH